MLDSRYKPAKIAYFGADQFVLLRFDTINEKPSLTIMSADGQIVRMLDDQNSLPNGSDLQKGSGIKVDMALLSFSNKSRWWVHVGLAVRLCRQAAPSPSSPGRTRSSGPSRPVVKFVKSSCRCRRGQRHNPIVSSDRAWLVRSFIVASDAGLLLEFDPESGQVLRRIDSKGVPPTSIMYAGQGNYYALWWDKAEHSFDPEKQVTTGGC